MPAKARVVLIGDLPLLLEYAAACRERGMSVTVITGRSSPKLPRGARKATRPPRTATVGLELTNTDPGAKRKNLVALDRAMPRGSIILSSAVTIPLAEQSGWITRTDRLVGLGALPSFLEGNIVELSTAQSTQPAFLDKAIEFVESLGKEPSIVKDSVGCVLPRIVCSITNEACFALMEGVAHPKDIDTAMKLGTNYPLGPVEWGEKIGPEQVLAVIEALHRFFGEDRYRPSPYLRTAARKGTFF